MQAAGDNELKWTTANFQTKKENQPVGDSVSQAGAKVFASVKVSAATKDGLNKEKLSQLEKLS